MSLGWEHLAAAEACWRHVRRVLGYPDAFTPVAHSGVQQYMEQIGVGDIFTRLVQLPNRLYTVTAGVAARNHYETVLSRDPWSGVVVLASLLHPDPPEELAAVASVLLVTSVVETRTRKEGP